MAAAIRSGEPQPSGALPGGAVGDRGRVVGQQRHQPFGAARGGGVDECLDDAAGGRAVDGTDDALGGHPAPGAVGVLLARGLGDVEDLGDLRVGVRERLA
jgi:hypothetical protein